MSVKGISWNQTVFSVMRTTTHLTYATLNVSHRTTHLVTIHVILRVVTKSALRAIQILQHSVWKKMKVRVIYCCAIFLLVPIMKMRGQAPLRELLQQFRLI